MGKRGYQLSSASLSLSLQILFTQSHRETLPFVRMTAFFSSFPFHHRIFTTFSFSLSFFNPLHLFLFFFLHWDEVDKVFLNYLLLHGDEVLPTLILFDLDQIAMLLWKTNHSNLRHYSGCNKMGYAWTCKTSTTHYEVITMQSLVNIVEAIRTIILCSTSTLSWFLLYFNCVLESLVN